MQNPHFALIECRDSVLLRTQSDKTRVFFCAICPCLERAGQGAELLAQDLGLGKFDLHALVVRKVLFGELCLLCLAQYLS